MNNSTLHQSHLDVSRLEGLRSVGNKMTARCPACAANGGDRKGHHLVIYPNGKYGCAAHQGDAAHRRQIFSLVGVTGDRPMSRKLRADLRVQRRQERIEERKTQRLVDAAKSNRARIVNRFAWGVADVWEDSPQRIDSALVESCPRHFLETLFDADAVVWTGQVHESGVEKFSWHWRTCHEWVSENSLRIGPMVTPAVWSPGTISRSKANVATTPYTVLDFDGLDGIKPQSPEEIETHVQTSFGIIRWVREQLCWKLAAILWTGSKSLHAWFHTPPPDILDSLRQVAEPLGLDAGLIGRPEHPCRLPGQLHDKTGQASKVLWLQQRAPIPAVTGTTETSSLITPSITSPSPCAGVENVMPTDDVTSENPVTLDAQKTKDPGEGIQHELNFSLEEDTTEVSPVSSSAYQLITDPEELTAVASAIAGASSVALDSETYGPGKKDALNPRKGKIRLLQLAIPDHSPWLIDLDAVGQDLGPLKPALEAAEVIIHNARFDLGFLREQFEINPTRLYCTMTASQLLNAGTNDKNDLTSCLARHLSIPPYPDESRSDWSGALTESQLAYAVADVEHLHGLREALDKQIDQANLRRVADLEMELIPVVVGIEAAGLRIDTDELNRQIDKASQAFEKPLVELRTLSGKPTLNPRSSSQVQAVLRERGLNLPNTDKKTLAAHLGDDFVVRVLECRQNSQLASTLKGFQTKLDPDGRLRASFNPLGTCTGRFSSSHPNLQSIPRGAPRTIFKPSEGYRFVRADYSQIDLRVAAALTGEKKMLEAFHNGEDLHRLTAAFITNKAPADITKRERQEAKAVNFGFIYGQRPEGFRKKAKAEYKLDFSLKDAERFQSSFFRAYLAFTTWHKQARREAQSGAKETRTRTGRRRLIPSNTEDWGRFTALVNTPVQGLGADGMKLALIRLHNELPKGARIVLTVHDDVLIECLEELAEDVKSLVEQIMIEEMASLLPEVPIVVEAEILEAWK